MSHNETPLAFARAQALQYLQSPQTNSASLGDILSHIIGSAPHINNLLDCIPTSPAPALHSPDASRQSLTHQQIHDFIADFSLPNSTSHPPLGPNDRVMLVLPTGPENALCLLALASYHTVAPVNASCTAGELKEDAERLQAKAIVTTRDAASRLELDTLREELECDVIFVDGYNEGTCGFFEMSVMGPLDRRVRKPSKLHSLSDMSLVLHTSGTSGKKKVVPYTLNHLIVGTMCVVISWDLKERDVNMNMMPLFHVGGIVRNLWAPVLSGGSAIVCAGFDAMAFWNLAQQLHATWYYAAPTIHHAILTSQPEGIVPARDLSIRMICNAAGGLLPSLAVDLKERFGGAVILPSYGMTECMPITTPPTTYQLERPGCSGIACGPYLSIRNPGNIEIALAPGQTGAVSVRGLPTFSGYEMDGPHKPLDTSCFSSEGWFDSGDMGYMDDDGYLYITGRSKEIINKGGEVISPFEVEEAITTACRDVVKTTLAFAIDHDVLQECIGVVIVPVPGKPKIGLAQLQDMLRDHLHPSKWPFAIVYMADLPKNAAGKPLRIKLSTRLGLGQMADAVPFSQRHFEAEVPSKEASLQDPIRCKQLLADLGSVNNALRSLHGVLDVAVRARPDGTPEAFASVNQANADVNALTLKMALTEMLPGYSLPEPLHVLPVPLKRTRDGSVDFDAMEQEIMLENAASMSPRALVVRDIIAELLAIEAGNITGDSDFFLLGGNSLLLGKLAYQIRKQTGASLQVSQIFTNSTVNGIAALVDQGVGSDSMAEDGMSIQERGVYSAATSVTLGENEPAYPYDDSPGRSNYHPLVLLVQIIPFIFFYPLKAAVTWSILLYVLTYLAPVIDLIYVYRMLALLAAIFAGRLASRIIAPITAIAFKWLVIGKYKPGTYKMWSNYYLRYWIVNQSLRSAGRGIFAMTPGLERLYYRLLGAKIGSDVVIMKGAKLGEYDLLTIEDGVRVDSNVVIRGFCVERDGNFRLDTVRIGARAHLNTYTQVVPGADIQPGEVYGPHASTNEAPSPEGYAMYNRTYREEPNFILKWFVAQPLFFLVFVASHVPWGVALWLMMEQVILFKPGTLNAMESVIYWFSDPERVAYHALSRVLRVVATPLLQLVLGIIVKRMFGLNKPCDSDDYTQIMLLRRYINVNLLNREKLKAAFSILGTHYEIVSHVYRAMGAKIGKRVYWPGSSLVCDDPELLDIGNDVVFGSRSELITSDTAGMATIKVGNGAMIADRCVLLAGTTVGHRAVMGSGALSKRNGYYENGSTWMGNNGGEAICFNKGNKDLDLNQETTTPFGRAYHMRMANFFVFPYIMLLAINVIMAACSAAYWSISAVVAAQCLRILIDHAPVRIFEDVWYRFGILYGLIAGFFIVVLNLQAIISMCWVLLTKWTIIGRRQVGRYDWDKSSYCQRWQLHLTVSRPMYKGYGNGGVLTPLTGTIFAVWFFRAMGATIGNNVCLYPGGKAGLMTEPDLVELGNNVALDNCSVVAHINSRGNFALNALKIADGSAMRTGSRLLSGASMEDSSMLCEHSLLTSGEIAEAGGVYVGWPARRVDNAWEKRMKANASNHGGSDYATSTTTLMPPPFRS